MNCESNYRIVQCERVQDEEIDSSIIIHLTAKRVTEINLANSTIFVTVVVVVVAFLEIHKRGRSSSIYAIYHIESKRIR